MMEQRMKYRYISVQSPIGGEKGGKRVRTWAVLSMLLLCAMLLVASTPLTTETPSRWLRDVQQYVDETMHRLFDDRAATLPLVPTTNLATRVEEPHPFTAVLSGTEPLTGVPTVFPTETDRPIVVMVENSFRARPQSGLIDADIVYEALAEGNITRFVAVFHSASPSVIGPVRSIRPYFVQLAHGLDGLLVHAGWSQDAMIAIERLGVDHLDQVYGDHKYYWRDRSRRAPHNLYTGIDRVREAFSDQKMRTAWNVRALDFALDQVVYPEGVPTHDVVIPYLGGYRAGYTYDKLLGVYVRTMNGAVHKDKTSDRALTANNVLIVEARHRILDKVGRRDVDIQSGGRAVLLQSGRRQDVWWKWTGGIIRPYVALEAPDAIPLIPGTTWIQIVEQLDRVAFSETTP
jgi:hypothetical protein